MKQRIVLALVTVLVLGFASPALTNGDPFTGSDISTDEDINTDVAWGDVDGDGHLDLVVAVHNAPPKVYKNNGNGTFAEGVNIGSFAGTTWSIVLGDVDRDGHLDLVVGYFEQANKVYKNNGDGTFAEGVNITDDADTTHAIVLGDVDGDGDLDVVAGNDSGTFEKLYKNNGDGTFSSAVNLENAIDETSALALGDADGDGDLDLAACNPNWPNRLYKNNGDGTFAAPVNLTTENTEPCTDIAFGDADGDGDLDLIIAYSTGGFSGTNKLHKNNGDGTFAAGVPVSADENQTQGVAWGDVDGDGDLDLAVVNLLSAEADKLYKNNGDGTFADAENIHSEGRRSRGGAWGDADGDGDLDFAVVVNSAVAPKVNRLYKNNTNHASTVPTTPALTDKPNGEPGTVRLQWAPATDAQTTDADLLTYNVRVGTSSGANDVLSSVIPAGPGNAGHSTSITLSLSAGTYFWSVQAVDTTYSRGAFATEGTFTLTSDSTPPTAGTISDAGQYISGSGFITVTFNWQGFADAESNIAEYSFSVGTFAGGSDVAAAGQTSAGDSSNNQNIVINPPNGTTYYVTLQAKNGAGLYSTAVTTDGITYDNTAPTGGVVDDGNIVGSATTVNASWSGFADAESGLTEYSYSVGTSAGDTSLKDWTSAGTNTSAAITGLTRNLVQGETIFVNVQAINGVSIVGGVKSSDGSTVNLDSTPPQAGLVQDDGQYTTSNTTLSASWAGATVCRAVAGRSGSCRLASVAAGAFGDDESGITEYSYSIGVGVGDTSVVPWTTNGTATSVNKTGLALTDGTTYYVNVRAKNGANLLSDVASSDGITVDGTAPTVSNLIDGTAPGTDATETATTSYGANWTATDPHSGITSQTAVLKDAQNNTVSTSATLPGTATSVTFTGIALTEGATYTITVTATNGAGLTSDPAATNGVTAIPVYPLGDINGDGKWDNDDVTLALQALTGQITLTEAQRRASRVVEQDAAGPPTIDDANLILRCALGQITSATHPWCTQNGRQAAGEGGAQ